MRSWLTLCLIVVFVPHLQAQDENRLQRWQHLKERFDTDGDGKLSNQERQKVREFLRDRRRGNQTGKPSFDPATSGLYKAAAGPWQFDKSDLQLDRHEGDALSVRVTRPTNSESGEKDASLPVIVFSHGAGGSHRAYVPLIEHWASHGYVCLQPTHGDSISLRDDARGDLRDNVKSLRDHVRTGDLGKHMFTRTDDVKLILDNLEEIEKRIPALEGKLDEMRLGMGGHSFGAYTTNMIGGLKVRNGDPTAYSDDRPKALLTISPQGTGGLLDENSWDNIKLPIMVITGSNDSGRKGEEYTWRLEAWEHLSAETKYLAFIEEAMHNFGGIAGWYPGSGPANPDHVCYVQSASLAFWDSQLLGSRGATAYLQSDRMREITAGIARITRD